MLELRAKMYAAHAEVRHRRPSLAPQAINCETASGLLHLLMEIENSRSTTHLCVIAIHEIVIWKNDPTILQGVPYLSSILCSVFACSSIFSRVEESIS